MCTLSGRNDGADLLLCGRYPFTLRGRQRPHLIACGTLSLVQASSGNAAAFRWTLGSPVQPLKAVRQERARPLHMVRPGPTAGAHIGVESVCDRPSRPGLRIDPGGCDRITHRADMTAV